MALNLGRLGYDVELFEQLEDPRATGGDADAGAGGSGGGGGGRSINLAISTRGVHALREADVADTVLANAIPMPGRMIHSPEGTLAFQPYGTRPEHVINAVSRLGLNINLIDAADALSNVRLYFNQRISDIEPDSASFTARDAATDESRRVQVDVIVGADGAFSVVRARLARLDRFDFSQSYLAHGYKELTIPPVNGGFCMEKNALHIWPRGGYMMIALPNHDGSFTCTLFWPFEGPNSFANLQTREEISDFFSRNFPDAVPHMPELAEEYLHNPTSSLVTVRCGPWYYRNRVVLVGDACHAVVPFFGQGANAAFEDCSVLRGCLERHAPDWQAAFAEYYDTRKAHLDVLADLCVNNFVEMRDHVASASFRLKKKLEAALHRTFPRWFLPLYSMVAFSRIPYGDAKAKADRQKTVIMVGMLGVIAVAVILGVRIWN